MVTAMASENSMEMRRVGEIMIPLANYPHLPVWSSLLDALKMMHRAEIEHRGRKSLPRVILLFDLDGSISGTVRRRDLMRGLEPKFLISQPLEYHRKLYDVEADPNLAELSFDRVVKGIREQVDRPVADVMQPIERTIDYNQHVMTAVYEMVSRSLSILPVMQRGKVVGVLRTVDVFHELAEVVI